MSENEQIKGYKVFGPNWTCRYKQYTCPGKFEEDVDPEVCSRGMHFCRQAVDCFKYYDFNPQNRFAEVIAYGTVSQSGEDSKCATNKLEIVREVPLSELLDLVNIGNGNSGIRNSGIQNSGDGNSGNWNSGHRNSGNWNSGNWNSGNWNSGYQNSGDWNSGNWNSGNRNSGDGNSGYQNSGYQNSGDGNSGDGNSGDWNKTDYSSGCFNTKEQKILLFDKPSEWTLEDWRRSDACSILKKMPPALIWVPTSDMTDEEKSAHPEHETTGGFLRAQDAAVRQQWWDLLDDKYKQTVRSIPNFDAKIFKEITGIDTGEEEQSCE